MRNKRSTSPYKPVAAAVVEIGVNVSKLDFAPSQEVIQAYKRAKCKDIIAEQTHKQIEVNYKFVLVTWLSKYGNYYP